MKIYKNRATYSLILALASLLLWSSCTKEPLDSQAPGQYDGQGVDMTLYLTVSGNFAPNTRLTDTEETDIKDLLLFAFKGGVLSYVLSVDAVNNTPGNQKSFTATLKASDNESDTYKLMILANSSRVRPILGTDLKALNGQTYAHVQSQLNSIADISKGIPMWGETHYLEINSSRAIPSIGLLRGVARIDIGVNAAGFDANGLATAYQGIADFRLNRIHVNKSYSSLSYVPLPSNVVGLGGRVSVTAPTLVANEVPKSTMIQVSPNVPNGFVRDLYFAEHDVKHGETKPGGAAHQKRSAIVVEGSYKGANGFYRLDFVDKAGNLIDILRNHIYQFNITKVSGVGFPTYDEAYASASINMSAEVVAWNVQDKSDVVFDRTNYLTVDTREVRVNADGFAVPVDYDNPAWATITVKSNAGGRITFPGYIENPNDTTEFTFNLSGGRGSCTAKVTGTNKGPGVESVYTIVFMFDMLNYDHPGYTFPTVLAIGNMRMPLDVVMENRKKYLDITPVSDDFALSGGGVVEFNLVSDQDWTASITAASNNCKATVTPISGVETKADKPTKVTVTFQPLDLSSDSHNVGGYVDIRFGNMNGVNKTIRIHQQKHVVWAPGYLVCPKNAGRLTFTPDNLEGGSLFKPGSVIALSSGPAGMDYVIGGPSYHDSPFTVADIVYNPSNIVFTNAIWYNIPSLSNEKMAPRLTPESGYHTLDNILKYGKGDPCRLVLLLESEIKKGVIDNKVWRLPTYGEAKQDFHDRLHSPPDPAGAMYTAHTTGSQHYFVWSGTRRRDSGYVQSSGFFAYTWTSTPCDEVVKGHTSTMAIRFFSNAGTNQAYSDLSPSYTGEAANVRCVRQ